MIHVFAQGTTQVQHAEMVILYKLCILENLSDIIIYNLFHRHKPLVSEYSKVNIV